MPVIKVWCLPDKQTEEDLRKLHQALVAAVVSRTEFGLKDQNDMTCVFPPDQMQYGLGEEIVVEVTGLFEKPRRNHAAKEGLAKSIGEAVSGLYPKAKVEVFVATFKQNEDGFWTSKKPESPT